MIPIVWVALLFAVMLAIATILSWRIRELHRELEDTRRQLARLTKRVFEMERPAGAVPVPQEAPREAAREAPPPLPVTPVVAAPQPTVAAPEREPVMPMQERLRQRLSAEEWEAVVGGSWLNRAGVLILVIGIALFLGYSLTRLGPGGKIGVGLAVSVAMLGTGAALERRPTYANFARGFIGGGWAIAYFTVFAMYGVPAARIISSPVAAMALLLAVAAGMIVHSLRYRAQVITGLAYFAAFLALKIGPPTTFAVAASIPLAASLLFVAQRFLWLPLAAAGLVLTYSVFGLDYRGSFELENPLLGEPVLWIYWLLFEAFDIFEQRRAGGTETMSRTIFLLNAAGLVGASLLTWLPPDSAALSRFLAVAAAAFLGSALVRARILPARPESSEQPWFGVWEPAVTVSALLALFAIVQRFSGIGITIGLLMEAEFVALAGVLLGSAYLRWMGAALFLIPVFRLCLIDYGDNSRISELGFRVHRAAPLALLAGAAAWVNRRLHATAVYSAAGSLLFAVLAFEELPEQYLGLAWLLLAACLALATVRTRAPDLALEAGILGALSVVPYLIAIASDSAGARVPLAIGIVVLYVGGAMLRRPFHRAAEACFAAGSFYTAALAWRTLPTNAVALAWAVLGLMWLVAGMRWSAALRAGAYLIALAALVRVEVVNFEAAGALEHIAAAILLAATFYGSQFLTPRGLDLAARPYFSVLGTATIVLLLFREVSGRGLTVAVGLQGVTLLVAGFPLRERVLRLSGLALFFFCILKLFVYDLRQLDTFSRIVSFIVLGLLLVGASWVYTRFREQIQRML